MSGRVFCLCFLPSNSILICTKLSFLQFEPIFLWWQLIFQCPFSSCFFLLTHGELSPTGQLCGRLAASQGQPTTLPGFKYETELYSLLKSALWEPVFSGSFGIAGPRWLELSLCVLADGVCGASWLFRTFAAGGLLLSCSLITCHILDPMLKCQSPP